MLISFFESLVLVGILPRGIMILFGIGVLSVVAGRFIGPLRPIIPAVVGFMHMRPLPFPADGPGRLPSCCRASIEVE